jgi:hypothetical protein
MSSISEDMWNFLKALVSHGMGYVATGTTNGTGVPALIASEVDNYLPALTLLNTSSTITLYWGYNGRAEFPLAPGASYTFRYKVPRRAGICISDKGAGPCSWALGS